jgi:TonB-linked SusC/RagA family outer membrane protein
MSLAIAQNKQVSGTVTDEAGELVVGASVLAKGTALGGITDSNGKFSFSVPESVTTLVVRYIGYVDVEIPAEANILVRLKSSSTELDEVTVVAYGVVAKSGAPFGAKVTVKSDRLEVPLTSFDKALQGNAAGVLSLSNSGQPGAGQQVVIRGVGTINGGTTPLYVLDGIPIATTNLGNMTQTAATSSADNMNPLSNLNPNDIESVTILKDAASTAIYGSRAANGVVYITTKQGKAGKTQFNVKLGSGYSSRTSNDLKMLNKDQYINYITDARRNAGYNDGTTQVGGKDVNTFLANNFRVRNAEGDFYDFDWMGATYKNDAPTITADFSAAGGTDKTKFFLSLSLLDQDGIVIDTDLKRYTGRVNLDHTVNNHVKFGVNTLLSYNVQRSPMTTSGYYASPVFGAAMYSPLDAGIIAQGSTLYNPTAPNTPTPLDPGPNIDYITTYANANFLANSAYDDFSSRTARNITNVYGQWSFLDGFVLKGTVGYDYYYLTEEEWRDARPKGNSASNGRGLAESSVTEQYTWDENITLNYLKTISDSHNLNILVGQEAQAEGYRYSDAIAQDFPGSYFHYLSQGATPYGVYGARYASSLASFFSSVNYNYDQKYFLSGSLRSDGSSRLSKDNRWSTFWSAGVSWKVKRENFLQSVDAINDLTFRASYGTSGNQSGISRYAALALYSGVGYNGGSGLYPNQIENPNLTWEKTGSLDIGLDVSVLNNRLGATIDWYKRNTTDVLLNAQLSRTTGFEQIVSNVGEMYNTGVELALNGTPVRTKDVLWTVNFNISTNKNRITKLYEGNDIINGQFIYREGEDVHSLYAYRWAGVNPADGRPMYYDEDGEIMYASNEKGDTRQIVGSASPKFYGGLNTKITAYGVDLGLGFSYVYGNKIYDSSWLMFTSLGYRALYNQYNTANDYWRKEGDVVAFPKPVYGYAAATYGTTTDKSVFDGSYIRLRDITLGYSLPQQWIASTGLRNIRVYAQGTNLLTFTKFPDFDPEVGGGRLAGYYYLGYPNASTVMLGLDVKF